MKKTGTEQFIPRIKDGFIHTMQEEYDVPVAESLKLIESFLIVIEDASDYLFSLNHARAYSFIGYVGGYLRYHYPLEYLTVMLNVNDGNLEKTKKIVDYAKSIGIKIAPPTFGKSKSEYFFDKNTNTIYKGIKSVKYMNEEVAEALYNLAQAGGIESFPELLANAPASSRHIDTLIKIGYFRQFGTVKNLLDITEVTSKVLKRKTIKKGDYDDNIVRLYAGTETEKLFKDIDSIALCNHLAQGIADGTEFEFERLAFYEYEFTGDVSIIDASQDRRNCIVLDINTKYTPTLKLYRINNGDIIEVKVQKNFYYNKPLKKFDKIYVSSVEKRNKKRLVEGVWVTLEEYNFYISYLLI